MHHLRYITFQQFRYDEYNNNVYVSYNIEFKYILKRNLLMWL